MLRGALDAAADIPAGDGPTTRRLDLPVAVADAQRALGVPQRRALSAAQREAAFRGGAESPLLEDGLAGIGLARLALAGDGPATRAVTTAIVLRADAAARDQPATG